MTSRRITIDRWLLVASVAIVTPVAAQPPAQTPPAIAPTAPASPAPAAPVAPPPAAPVPPPETAQLPDVTASSEDGAPASAPPTEAGEETIEVVDRAPPGARAELTKEALERDEHDDLHKVLRGVAG